MKSVSRRIIFNRYTPPLIRTRAIHVYSNEPVVQLSEEEPILRNDGQLPLLQAKSLHVPSTIFDTSLDWAFRGYIVHRLSASDTTVSEGTSGTPTKPSQNPLGTEPPRGISDQERRRQLHGLQARDIDQTTSGSAVPSDIPQRLCLFNVLVALEWIPPRRFLRQLEWAFQRASDFLYDVTDGTMAFGQVVFGGPELMDCADIQIMASNRFMPRSFVDGLHDPNSFSPIRLGRGIWQKSNQVSVSWDEPEGYRTIIHEWGHYALALRDEYLSVQYFAPDQADSSLLRLVQSKESSLYKLTIPGISLALETIMSTLATSELMPQKTQNSYQRRTNEWNRIAQKQEFAFLEIDSSHQPIDGPMRLPLPLPQIQHLESVLGATQTDADFFLALPSNIQAEHCWVYVIKGDTSDPQQIIAQGTIDARTPDDGFRLLGANIDDTVVLIGLAATQDSENNLSAQPIVLHGVIERTKRRLDGYYDTIIRWAQEAATPATFPIVDVIPVDPPNGQASIGMAPRWINVHVQGEGSHTAQKWVFPLGETERKLVTGEPLEVQSLDGHVFVGSADGKKLTISSYSYGGGPGGSPPVHANPIAAGSSEGNVLLFFYDETQGSAFGPEPLNNGTTAGKPEYNNIRIITTVNHGIPAPENVASRSYAFSLASNTGLPEHIAATLVAFYEPNSVDETGTLRIYRLADDRQWKEVPTYLPHELSFAATPLTNQTAGGLFGDTLKVEHYRLCLKAGSE